MNLLLDGADINLLMAVALFVLWLYAAWLVRSEVTPPGAKGPRPVVGFIIASATMAFALQMLTPIVPALADDVTWVFENVPVIQLIAGVMRGVAFVLLVAYILYRRQETTHG